MRLINWSKNFPAFRPAPRRTILHRCDPGAVARDMFSPLLGWDLFASNSNCHATGVSSAGVDPAFVDPAAGESSLGPGNAVHFGCVWRKWRKAGARPLMGAARDAYDNALCERFLAALECGLLDRLRFRKPSEVMRGRLRGA